MDTLLTPIKEENKKEIQFASTSKEFSCSLSTSIGVSKCAHWVVGLQSQESAGYKLIKESFDNELLLEYPLHGEIHTESILISETHNVVLCGIVDQKMIVYNLTSGEAKKTLKVNIGDIDSFFGKNDLCVIGGRKMIKFLDLQSLEVQDLQFDTECKYALTVNILKNVDSSKTKKNDFCILVGGTNSSNLTKIFVGSEYTHLLKLYNALRDDKKDEKVLKSTNMHKSAKNTESDVKKVEKKNKTPSKVKKN